MNKNQIPARIPASIPAGIPDRIQQISHSMTTHFIGGLAAVLILFIGLFIGHSSAQATANEPVFKTAANGKKILPRDKSQMMFQEISVALSNYRSTCGGSFPTTEQGLAALVHKPDNSSCSYPEKGFTTEEALKDKWGNPFRYESDGQHYKITSLGADGKEGGVGEDMDIVSTN